MSISAQVLVDDSDPRITYAPAGVWRTMGSEMEYNSTTHALLEGAGSFSFNFNGTGITIQTTVPALGGGEYLAEVTCKVDGATISTITPDAGYHKRLCRTSTLSANREHLLEVEVVRDTAGPPFYFDYLVYDAELEIDLDSEEAQAQDAPRMIGPGDREVRIMVDDADERIVYAGSWAEADAENEHWGTTHITRAAGATATYTFNGTGIAVYGTLGVEEGVDQFIATFTVDNHPAVSYTPSSRDLRYRTRFFQSPTLDEGEHTLEIKDTTENARAIVLDYLVQTISPVSLLPETTIPGPRDSTSSRPPAPQEDTSKPNVPLIAGATVGGVIVLVILLGLLLWTRRRRSRRRYIDLAGPETPEPFSVQATPGLVTVPVSFYRSSQAPVIAARKGPAHPPAASVAPPQNPIAPPPKQHQDGGVRLEVGVNDGDEPRDDVPPVYQASYS